MASLPVSLAEASHLPATVEAAGATSGSPMFQRGRARARCPHCKSAANCRTSREITLTHREFYYECTNLFCGHAWHASESYDYGLRPSAIPDPAADLPLRVPSRQDVLEMMRDRDPAQPDMFDVGGHLPAASQIEPGEDPDSGCG